MKFHRLSILSVCCVFLVNAAEPPSAFGSRTPRYHLLPNDVISVQYRYSPEFDQTAAVQPDGFVSLQLIGSVKISGLTLDEVRELIAKTAAEHLNEPVVTVTLSEYQKPYITVAGEVSNPGRVELRGRVTAVEAIAMAGGFKQDRAKHSQVILFRRVSPDLAETKLINLKALMKPQGLKDDEDVLLASGDILVVQQNNVSKIERYIHWANVGMFLSPSLP